MSALLVKNPDFKKPDINLQTDIFKLEQGKGSYVTAKINVDGKYKYINSKYDPIKEAETFALQTDIEPEGTLLCFGFGLGYHVRELFKRLDKKNVLIVVEPSKDFFDFVLMNVDIADIIADSRLKIIVGASEVVLRMNFSKISNKSIMKSKVVCWPAYKDIYDVDLKHFLSAYRGVISDRRIGANTNLSLSYVLQVNYIKNMKYVLRGFGVGDFLESYSNRPVILVAAGPSLAKNIEFLKEAKGRVLIIAVYSVKAALEKQGIRADIYTVIDPFQTIHERKQNIDIKQEELLAALTTSDPYLLENSKDVIFNMNSHGEYLPFVLEDKKKLRRIEIGGSVAIYSLTLAHALGANPIIFVGQDLAYTDEKTHVEGTTHEFLNLKVAKKGLMVDDVYGNKVWTSEVLNGFRSHIESFILRHNDRTYIDATEGGAYIAGTKVVTLKETLETWCPVELCIDEYLDNMRESSKLFKDIDSKVAFLEKLKKALEKLELIAEKSLEAVEYSQKAVKSVEYKSSNLQNDIKRYQKKMGKIKKEIGNYDFETAIVLYILSLLENQMKSAMDLEEDGFNKIVRMNLLAYTNLGLIAEETIPILSETIDEMEEMLNKEKEGELI